MNKEELRAKFTEIHGNDQEQLDFILSEENRIIVTAPAGCGKTKAMISKIAHEIITNDYLNNKRILALTFSVNAAAKIREDIKETLPILLGKANYEVDDKLDVSNYHGFANRILRKHGYILHDNFKNINDFIRISDNSGELRKVLVSQEIRVLENYDESLKKLDFKEADRLQGSYIDIVLTKLVPRNIITYNGILLLAMQILDKKAIRDFYKLYYQMVIVDEFQDTNYLALQFLMRIVEANKVILMGDDIQKIYGFLGAVPNIFKKMENEYNMLPMEFRTNYRFKDNKNMKQLDSYIRGIFRNYNNIISYSKTANINFKLFNSDNGEARFIYKDLLKYTTADKNVAILFRAKYLASDLINILEKNKIMYFNGLFEDSDPEYIKFHKEALEIFINESGVRKSISRTVITSVKGKLNAKKQTITNNETMFNSLMRLLDALLDTTKAKNISTEEKYEAIIFTLSNNSLKRLMNEINEQVTLTTIHSSKGLEWDYVYLPNMTSYSFPTSKSLCKLCSKNNGRSLYEKHCKFDFVPGLEEPFYEELSVLYVALTRGKQDVFLTASRGPNQFGYNKKVNCFLTLPKLKIINNF
ncbi:UvrD-helicase domain-containing protein [Heyndrickxia vini]|uniref:DNA 3'-5' helicase n=1 Tax=Heyndrickxia vini TaxID=1476025 RepID=A0ABX7E2H2_9BACI|nr:ATP-dependent helicase [Heyndrickxia vini]QQZ09419.1 ATP-dependent helicase [Heyndrickxia vini]